MMIKLKSDKIKVGMFVILQNSLLDNPFWKSQFIIKNEKQIQKIVKGGFKEVKVDTDKSRIEIKTDKQPETLGTNEKKVDDIDEKEKKTLLMGDSAFLAEQFNKVPNVSVLDIKTCPKKEYKIKGNTTTPTKWEPERFMPVRFVEALKDTSMPPVGRARAVQDYSIELMKNILKNPTASTISASKEGIADVVDVIMKEDDTCESLTKMVSHDFYTYTHSVNVGIKSVLLAKEFYRDCDSIDNDMRELGIGFFLHDVGKVKIPKAIINKPGKLSDVEMEIMRKHPDESNKILIDADKLINLAKVIVLQHHERNDGTGYPFGLRGFDIHPYATICSLADVYDALTGKRSYKEKIPPKEALGIMRKEMANHFNKDMLEDFICLLERNGVV